MSRPIVWLAGGLFGAIAALAGGSYAAGPDGSGIDLSAYPTRSELSAAVSAMQATVQAQIPQPASTAPPMEAPGGAAGSTNTFRRGDAVQPRITRSKTVTLATDGTATFDWTAQGALATPGQVAITPVYTGGGVPKCWVTALSATVASIKCVVETVSLTTIAGITVGSVSNAAANGLQVGVIALPPS